MCQHRRVTVYPHFLSSSPAPFLWQDPRDMSSGLPGCSGFWHFEDYEGFCRMSLYVDSSSFLTRVWGCTFREKTTEIKHPSWHPIRGPGCWHELPLLMLSPLSWLRTCLRPSSLGSSSGSPFLPLLFGHPHLGELWLTPLSMVCLHKSFGILQYRSWVSFPHWLNILWNHRFILVWTHEHLFSTLGYNLM